MGILNFLFGRSSGSSRSSSSSNHEKMYNVRIKGTIQANGPKIINHVVQMNETQMRLFSGSKRYEAIEGWVNANYPGARINNIRSFGVEIKPAR